MRIALVLPEATGRNDHVPGEPAHAKPAIAEIDQTGAEGDPILPALMSAAEMLDVTAIAEGIETEDQLDRIRQAGCVGATGNYLAPAAPAETTTAFLHRHRSGARS